MPAAMAADVRRGILDAAFAGVSNTHHLGLTSTGLTGVPLRPAMTFGVAFVVPSERPLSPVAQALAGLVATTYGKPL